MQRTKRQPPWYWGRRGFTNFLLVLGTALLIYVAIEYGSMYLGQRRLEKAWEQQNSATPSASQNQAVQDDGLTRLSIPKISLDAVVVEGTAYKQLAIAPGHLKGTSAPGDVGNAVISAHRDTFFRHIYELQKGDSLIVRRQGKTFNFEVTGKKIVQPEDVSVLRSTQDAQLTLLTCYPIYYVGPAPERLVVFSKLVGDSSQAASAEAAASSAANTGHQPAN